MKNSVQLINALYFKTYPQVCSHLHQIYPGVQKNLLSEIQNTVPDEIIAFAGQDGIDGFENLLKYSQISFF